MNLVYYVIHLNLFANEIYDKISYISQQNALYRIYRQARGVILVYSQSLYKRVSGKRRAFICKSSQRTAQLCLQGLQDSLWGGGKALKKFLIKPLFPIIRAQT